MSRKPYRRYSSREKLAFAGVFSIAAALIVAGIIVICLSEGTELHYVEPKAFWGAMCICLGALVSAIAVMTYTHNDHVMW